MDAAGLSIALIATVAIASAAAAIAFGVGRRRGARSAADAHQAEGRAEERSSQLAGDVASRDTVLSAMTEGVVLFAPNGEVAYANGAARGILGRRFDSVQEVTPAALRDAILAAADPDAKDGRVPQSIVRQFETASGVVDATVVPSTPPGSVVVVARDVTAARGVDRLRRDFVANASHELKTPVASILAIAETLRGAASDDPDATDRFLAFLEQEANRLSRLVRDLLELSRLEGETLEPAPVVLDRVVTTEAERLRRRAEAAGLSFVVDHLDPAEVLGSQPDLALLVHNLVDNAIRYTPGGGQVRVSLMTRDGSASIEVDDTGIGIPSSSLDRVFERFYRVDAARSRETGGTGLGLSIVRHVAESHGGQVRVESVLGAGSTFIVRLPLAPARPLELAERSGPDQRPQLTEPAGSGSSIT